MRRKISIFTLSIVLGILYGAHSSSAQVTIEIDATALSATGINLSGVGGFNNDCRFYSGFKRIARAEQQTD